MRSSVVMGTEQNWLKAKFRVEFQRAAESARFFKRLIRKEGKKGRAELKRLAKKVGAVLPEVSGDGESAPHPPPGPLPRREGGERKRNTAAQRHAAALHRRDACATDACATDACATGKRSKNSADQRVPWDPGRPGLWHRRLVDAQLAKPEVREIYFSIRRAIWDWPEFASLGPGARAVLEVVVELARDEAFPWYVGVPSHEVRRLARLSEGGFARCVRELSCFVVSRPAKVVKLTDDDGVVKMWPTGRAGWEVEDAPRFDRAAEVVAPHAPPGPLPRREGEADSALTPALSQREREQERAGWEVEDAPRFDRAAEVVAPHPPPGPLPRREGEADSALTPALSLGEREQERAGDAIMEEDPHPGPPPRAALTGEGVEDDGGHCLDTGETPVPPVDVSRHQQSAPSRSRLVQSVSIPQFALIYRRGVPWNAKRAAWWINYDLLCGTGLVMPCFVLSLTSLQKTYQARNDAMGAWPGVTSDWALEAMRVGLAKYGPTPELGMRAALWRARGARARSPRALAGD